MSDTATTAIIGKGTTLGYGATPTLIAEVVDCDLPEVTVGNVDATHYHSPNSQTEKLSAVWQDLSDITFMLNFTKAQCTTLLGLVGTTQSWTVTLPDSSTWVFNGFLSKFGGGKIPNKDIIRMPGTITVTSALVFTAGS